MERNESSEVDVKPFVGLVNLNPEYASRTSVVQRESYEVGVKPSIQNCLFLFQSFVICLHETDE